MYGFTCVREVNSEFHRAKGHALLRSQSVGVLWEGSLFISPQQFERTFASNPASPDKRAHFGTIRGQCLTKTWIVCPRKHVVLAFTDGKSSPENRSVTYLSGK